MKVENKRSLSQRENTGFSGMIIGQQRNLETSKIIKKKIKQRQANKNMGLNNMPKFIFIYYLCLEKNI